MADRPMDPSAGTHRYAAMCSKIGAELRALRVLSRLASATSGRSEFVKGDPERLAGEQDRDSGDQTRGHGKDARGPPPGAVLARQRLGDRWCEAGDQGAELETQGHPSH